MAAYTAPDGNTYPSPQDYITQLENIALQNKNTSIYDKQIEKIKEINKEHGTTSVLVQQNIDLNKEALDSQTKLWTFLERNFKKGTDAIKNYRDAAQNMKDNPGAAMMALAQEGLDYLQREADVREQIIETINTTGKATKMMTRNLMEAELETLKWGTTSEDLAK